MHKFFEEGQVKDTRQVADEVVIDARRKMDGTMVFGVVHPTEGWVELWTRAGPNGPAKWATRHAEGGSAGDVLGLVGELDRRGYTACFEWVGRQARIKERHDRTELYITQVRNKISGRYMGWKQMQAWANSHKVKCVEWAAELVGLSVAEASAKVIAREGVEGFVVQTRGGITLKLKTAWWHEQWRHRYYGWHNKEQRQFELEKRQHKGELMQVQGCRAVVQGWAAEWSPARILDQVAGVVKAEEFIARDSGKRGAIVVSFRTPEERNDAVEMMGVGKVKLKAAYSSRSNGNAYHRIRTYWSTGERGRGG